jgi:hypothetical protein
LITAPLIAIPAGIPALFLTDLFRTRNWRRRSRIYTKGREEALASSRAAAVARRSTPIFSSGVGVRAVVKVDAKGAGGGSGHGFDRNAPHAPEAQ